MEGRLRLTIVKDHATRMMEGGADVRRPGGVRGW